MLPLHSLVLEHRELGLLIAVLLGFGFGFVLERAGFGRADKLAAQFYLHDMTVFKVMFGAIITAMLGVMALSGAGLVNLKLLSESAVSFTYIWPMIVGGAVLGVGFIISGYCPGTSLVAMTSGHLDGAFTVAGVVLGSLLYGELFPLLADFHVSGDMGHLFLYDVLGLPPQLLAVMVAVMAVAMFIGAERVERIFSRKRNGGAEPEPAPRRPRRYAFAAVGSLCVLALAALALPREPRAAASRVIQSVDQQTLARRVLDEPWRLRILDLRDRKACVKARLPGSECAPKKTLDKLGLAYSAGARDLVLVGERTVDRLPAAVRAYPGKVLVLQGGFAGWKRYALTRPAVPGPGATPAQQEEYRFRSSLHAAMTGRKAPPPPAAGAKKYAPKKRKKKGGGCS